MSEYSHIANGPLLWAVTIVAVGIVLFQTLVFLKKSFTAGRKMGMSNEKLKTAFTTGVISAIGPSVVIVIGMVSLLIVVGGPTALMRLSYVGNVAYELLAVEFAADAYGVSTTAATPEVFCVALWGMAIGCVGWPLVAALFTDKMDKLTAKIAGSTEGMVPVISSAAMLGAYGYLNSSYVVSLDKNTVALVVGAVIMVAVTLLHRKYKKRWMNEWGLTFAMVVGVLIAALL